MALLEVKNIYKSFGGVKAIQNFSIEANAGEIHGIIGPNGAGKTTIFNTISGVYTADQGTVVLDLIGGTHGDGFAEVLHMNLVGNAHYQLQTMLNQQNAEADLLADALNQLG